MQKSNRRRIFARVDQAITYVLTYLAAVCFQKNKSCTDRGASRPAASFQFHARAGVRAQARRARWRRKAHACELDRSIGAQAWHRRRAGADGRPAIWKRMHVPCFSTWRASPSILLSCISGSTDRPAAATGRAADGYIAGHLPLHGRDDAGHV
jgi:hypothetical protein